MILGIWVYTSIVCFGLLHHGHLIITLWVKLRVVEIHAFCCYKWMVYLDIVRIVCNNVIVVIQSYDVMLNVLKSLTFCFSSFSLKRSKSVLLRRVERSVSFLAHADPVHFFNTSDFSNLLLTVLDRADRGSGILKSVRDMLLKFTAWRGTPVVGPSTKAWACQYRTNKIPSSWVSTSTELMSAYILFITWRWSIMSTITHIFPSRSPEFIRAKRPTSTKRW